MLNDILSDGITRLRNGFLSGKKNVLVLRSKLVQNVINILEKEGYIIGSTEYDKKYLNIQLKYSSNKDAPALVMIKRISRCGCRIYSQAGVYKKSNAYSILILSTNQGVMTHMEANKAGIGGEVLMEVF